MFQQGLGGELPDSQCAQELNDIKLALISAQLSFEDKLKRNKINLYLCMCWNINPIVPHKYGQLLIH